MDAEQCALRELMDKALDISSMGRKGRPTTDAVVDAMCDERFRGSGSRHVFCKLR